MRTSPRARASRPHAIDMVFSRTEHTPLLNEGARSPMEPARARRVRPRRSQVSPEGPLARTRRSCIDNTRDARGPASGGACSEATRAGAAAARVRAALVASLVPRAEVFPEPPSAWRRRARLVADGDPSPPSASPSPQDTGFLTFSLPRPPSSRPSSSSRRSRDFFLALPLRRRGASFATSPAPPSSASRSSPSSGPAPAPGVHHARGSLGDSSGGGSLAAAPAARRSASAAAALTKQTYINAKTAKEQSDAVYAAAQAEAEKAERLAIQAAREFEPPSARTRTPPTPRRTASRTSRTRRWRKTRR